MVFLFLFWLSFYGFFLWPKESLSHYFFSDILWKVISFLMNTKIERFCLYDFSPIRIIAFFSFSRISFVDIYYSISETTAVVVE